MWRDLNKSFWKLPLSGQGAPGCTWGDIKRNNEEYIIQNIWNIERNIWNVKKNIKNVISFPCIKKTTGVLCKLSSWRTSGFNFLAAVKFGLKFTLSKSPTQFQPQVTTTSKFDFLKINPYDSLFMFTIQCRCNAIQTQICFSPIVDLSESSYFYENIANTAGPRVHFILKLNHQVMKLLIEKVQKISSEYWQQVP